MSKTVTNEQVVIDLTPNPEVTHQTALVIADAADVQVLDATSSQAASALLVRVQRLRRWIADVYKTAKNPLNEARAKLIAQENAHLAPLVALESSLTKAINGYRESQDAARRAIEAEERRLAREAAEALQADRAAQLRAAATAAPSKSVAKRLEMQADAVESAPVLVTPLPPMPVEASLSQDVHQRVTWKAEVFDADALTLAIAAQAMINSTTHIASKEVVEYLRQFSPSAHTSLACVEPNMPTLNTLARALKQDMTIPGVRIVRDVHLIGR